jgi:hypothetical protein
MIFEDYFRRPSAIARYRLPPLGPLMDWFCQWLHAQAQVAKTRPSEMTG